MVYMYHSFLIHLSADGYLGCFHVLAIINSADTQVLCPDFGLRKLAISDRLKNFQLGHPSFLEVGNPLQMVRGGLLGTLPGQGLDIAWVNPNGTLFWMHQ